MKLFIIGLIILLSLSVFCHAETIEQLVERGDHYLKRAERRGGFLEYIVPQCYYLKALLRIAQEKNISEERLKELEKRIEYLEEKN